MTLDLNIIVIMKEEMFGARQILIIVSQVSLLSGSSKQAESAEVQ